MKNEYIQRITIGDIVEISRFVREASVDEIESRCEQMSCMAETTGSQNALQIAKVLHLINFNLWGTP